MSIITPYSYQRSTSGFSLVEMAIVLAIVALLLAGLLPTLSGQMEQQRRSETRKQLDDIRAALVGFAASQTPPRLPCPASPGIATGLNNAGVENCSISTGVLPWVALGTNETDAWGRRFTYTVASSVAGGNFASSFTLSSTGNLSLVSDSTGTCPGAACVSNNIPAIIISHGANGAGAWLPQGSQITASIYPDESLNSNGGTKYVSHDIYQNSFDDLVTWISPNILFNRMVAAGKLP